MDDAGKKKIDDLEINTIEEAMGRKMKTEERALFLAPARRIWPEDDAPNLPGVWAG